MHELLLVIVGTIPPTLVAVAALVTALKTLNRADEIHVIVNGNFAKLTKELADLKAAHLRLLEEGK